MKIVYISKSIIPSRSANSIHVMKMCQALAENGHDVTLISTGYSEKYEKGVLDDYEFYNVKNTFKLYKVNVPKIKGRTFIYAFKVLLYLLKNKSDLVYGRFLLGCYLSSIIGHKTIFESHAPIFNSNKFSKKIFNRLLKSKNFLKLVVISEKLKEVYVQNNVIAEQICVAHDGADKVNNLNKKVELKGNFKLNVGYTGHLYKGKGMEVIEKIVSSIPDVGFHIVGGTEKDVNYWSNKITSKNIFFYGFVSQDEVQSYINSLDICLLPNQKVISTYGDSDLNISSFTSPLKMFEYMASKKAIIASDLPVLKEVLNSTNSYLVGCDNYESWITAINELKDKEKRNEIASSAYKEFENNYTWKQRAKNILGEISNDN